MGLGFAPIRHVQGVFYECRCNQFRYWSFHDNWAALCVRVRVVIITSFRKYTATQAIYLITNSSKWINKSVACDPPNPVLIMGISGNSSWRFFHNRTLELQKNVKTKRILAPKTPRDRFRSVRDFTHFENGTSCDKKECVQMPKI